MEKIEILIDTAKKVQKLAQARHSGFKVGSAILCQDGSIFSGCNVESDSYGLSICAERVALSKALSEGKTDFLFIAVVGEQNVACFPCGACRQVLHDYAPTIQVIVLEEGKTVVYPIKELLPLAFRLKG
jgi:cytidine deaminase